MRQPIALHHLPRWSSHPDLQASEHPQVTADLRGSCHLNLVLNLGAVAYSIYSFKVGSFFLLATSVGMYISLNLTFFFWYWFVDYPMQVRHLNHQDHRCATEFPRESLIADPRWLPRTIDYLYFTVMTSNTHG
jgi:hypothetical protein